jgi:PelA/Pel-15E family pectate lyase
MRVAANMLLYQRSNGGWPKNYDEQAELTARQRERLLGQKDRDDTTFDNGATHSEVAHLSRCFAWTGDERYRDAALRGIEFMLRSQYDNGGWPQRHPRPQGYARHITFNDGAMVGVMTVLRNVALAEAPYAFVDREMRTRAGEAVRKGIDCILRCQIVVDGKRTAWCAQHDEKTLAPAKARSYELPSLSGAESVRVVKFLMQVDNPDRRIVEAIEAAIAWYREARLLGIRQVRIRTPGTPEGFDKVVVEDPQAPPMWARFYEIGTNRPIFCSRDGIPRPSLADISYERRNGYSWLGYYARDLLAEDYPAWQKRRGLAPEVQPACRGTEDF